jgi:exo-beta-1,3-glucanase (GH17 family)
LIPSESLMRAITPAHAVTLCVAIGLTFLAWWLPNRPVTLAQPFDGVIESVSFAPFRGTQSPLTGNYPSDHEIAQALDALVGKVRGVRLYTAREGMEIVPGLAQARGLKVFAGAWLGQVLRVNQAEVSSLIDLANRFPDTIDRVIVGNEVLLRRDLPVEKLIEHIRSVRAAIKQPVTYADVWEFWLQNPQLAAEVDFITIHILPYWEDFPLPVEVGNAHVESILAKVRTTFPGKPVVIGEIGWPTHGRSREAAVPGRVELATFLTNFLHKATAEDIRYNVIEAFDQPWKSEMEGTVGANWGLFDSNWQHKFNFNKPIVEEPRWPWGAALAALLSIVFVVQRRARAARLGLGRAVLTGLLLAVATYGGSRAVYEAYFYAYMWAPQVWAGLKAVVALGLGLALSITAFRILTGDARPAAGSGPAIGGDLVLSLGLGLAFALSFLLVVPVSTLASQILAPATVSMLWPILPVDGRYRDFPTVYLALAAVAPLIISGVAAATGRDRFLDRLAFGHIFGRIDDIPPKGRGWFSLAVGLGFIAMAVALLILETPANIEAWAWGACMVMMSLPFFAAVRWRWRLRRSARVVGIE